MKGTEGAKEYPLYDLHANSLTLKVNIIIVSIFRFSYIRNYNTTDILELIVFIKSPSHSYRNSKPVPFSLSAQMASISVDCSTERKFFQSPTMPLRINLNIDFGLVDQGKLAALSLLIFSKVVSSAIFAMTSQLPRMMLFETRPLANLRSCLHTS